MINKTPEQKARDTIDNMLNCAGWVVQSKKRVDLSAGKGVAVREQIIDTVNQDKILKAEWDTYSREKAQEVIRDFTDYIEANKDEITALSIFYDQPYRRREITFKMIKELFETLKLNKPLLAPLYVWEAWAQLDCLSAILGSNTIRQIILTGLMLKKLCLLCYLWNFIFDLSWKKL